MSGGVDAVFAPLAGEGAIPALAVGAASGSFAAVRTYGDAALDDSSVFEIGSITKTFTATAYADMVARGEVSPDDTVDRYLPVSTRRPITLEALATHASGLPRIPENLHPYVERDPHDPYVRYPVEDLFEALSAADVPSDPAPGYSNLGYAVLALALASAGDTTVPALIGARVLEPLGLEATTYEAVETVQGHRDGAPVPNWSPGVFWGAGGIRSCARDMLAYLRAQMRPDGSPLGPALREAHRARRALMPAQEVGLAWVTSTRDPPVVWHNGGTGGFGAFIGFCLRTRRGIVALGATKHTAALDRACVGWLRADDGSRAA